MDDIIYLNMVEMERNHWWYKGRREIIGKLILPYLVPDMKMLDAGCGAGGNMKFMEEYGSVVGIDISKEMVEYCRRRGLNVFQGSVTNIPFSDSHFDVVLCLDVLEHLPDEQSVLRELRRVVKLGGFLIFSVPAFSWLWGKHDEQNNHFRRYNFRQLVDILERGNLSIERSTYFNCLLLPFIWCIRRLSLTRWLARKTDFELGSGGMNLVLHHILKTESFLLKFTNLPIGVSQIVICRKK